MDLTTLLIIGLIIVVVVLLISRNRGAGYGGSPMYRDQTGPIERPTYDDPGYTSSGSIGGSAAEPPQERSVGGGSGSSGRTHDDPNYRSGGSIG